MPEIQDFLPSHAREHFILLTKSKCREARATYEKSLHALRETLAARRLLRSGMQELEEWNLSQGFAGNTAMAYLDAALETCHLYGIKLDQRLCTGIKAAIKGMLVAQRRNAIQHSAQHIPGAVKIPLSVRVQLSGDRNLPLFNEIMIKLEKARIESGSAMSKEQPMNQTFNVHGPNARVNINSNDNSKNQVHNGVSFTDLREAIKIGIADADERRAVLERLGELEGARDAETGWIKYTEFIATAHHHMALLGPYLPTIMHWLRDLMGASA